MTTQTSTDDDFVFTLPPFIPPFVTQLPTTETPGTVTDYDYDTLCSFFFTEPEMCDVQQIKDYLESCSIKENVLKFLRNITIYN